MPRIITKLLQKVFKVSFVEPQCTEYFEKVVDQILEDRRSQDQVTLPIQTISVVIRYALVVINLTELMPNLLFVRVAMIS